MINGSNSNNSVKYFLELYSIIWFLPEMERLFAESPSLRRNFFDRLIYGIDKNYLNTINKYKKKIIERNNILNQNSFDNSWIKQVENEIVKLGLEIYNKRKTYIDLLNFEISSLNLINKNIHSFKLIMKDDFFNKNIVVNDIEAKYLLELNNSRNIDSIIGGCKIGPHKSDFNGVFSVKNLNLNLCSTGQQKAIVILIILAQCNYLINSLNRQPIILFDEICSHLDKYNREILLELINYLDVQIFMTGTEKDSFSFLSTKVNYYYIN